MNGAHFINYTVTIGVMTMYNVYVEYLDDMDRFRCIHAFTWSRAPDDGLGRAWADFRAFIPTGTFIRAYAVASERNEP